MKLQKAKDTNLKTLDRSLTVTKEAVSKAGQFTYHNLNQQKDEEQAQDIKSKGKAMSGMVHQFLPRRDKRKWNRYSPRKKARLTRKAYRKAGSGQLQSKDRMSIKTAAFKNNTSGSGNIKSTAGTAIKTGVVKASKAHPAGIAMHTAKKTADKFKEALRVKQETRNASFMQMQQEGKQLIKQGATGEGEKSKIFQGAGLILASTVAMTVTAVGTAIMLIVITLIAPLLFVSVLIAIIAVIVSIVTHQDRGGADIIAVARQEYEVRSQNIGGAKYKTWYGLDADWCAMFVSWCANECDYIEQGVFPKTASVANSMEFYKEKGLYYTKESGYKPKTGDLIYFGTSHIGLVGGYDKDLDRVETFEGNTGRSETNPYHSGSTISNKFYPRMTARITGFASPGYPKGSIIEIPEPYGTEYSYMGWQMITSPSSAQYRLRQKAGMNFDENGFGKIGDRYVIACTTTYGEVGAYIDWELSNGEIMRTVIGDIKNQNDPGCNEWGHKNGACVVEFVVDKNSWYGTSKYPTNFHPEWSARVISAVRAGSFW